MIDYRIIRKKSFNEKTGELVSMLEHTRAVTLKDISTLDQFELDYLPDEGSNSIGSLLYHIASIEYVHQVITFENRDINDSEKLTWGTALELGAKARVEIKNNPLDYYLNMLSTTREHTLSLLQTKQDEWLYEEKKWGNGISYNNYWCWFHVMEDEINHRGQIRTIKRLLESRKK